MKTFAKCDEIQALSLQARADGKSIGFVPTMGFLHEGHLSLARRARAENDIVIVSIFVNPTQFGPNEDLARYPRDENRDLTLLRKENVDWVFLPHVDEIYPEHFSTHVEPPQNSRGWCGDTRPGHFRGVCTVVNILLNMARPTRLYLGQKDAQQAAVLRRMAMDFRLPVEVVACPTVREPDGLAMSSRNAYLSPEERREALVLHETLLDGAMRFQQGERSAQTIVLSGKDKIQANPLAKLDYLGIVDHNTFQPVEQIEAGCIYLGAAFVGKTRLIDNVVFSER